MLDADREIPSPMNAPIQTWWTRGFESPGGFPEAVSVRRVAALSELYVGECAFADVPLAEFHRDNRFHPEEGTPERSYRQRWLTAEDGGGHEEQFWMRMR